MKERSKTDVKHLAGLPNHKDFQAIRVMPDYYDPKICIQDSLEFAILSDTYLRVTGTPLSKPKKLHMACLFARYGLADTDFAMREAPPMRKGQNLLRYVEALLEQREPEEDKLHPSSGVSGKESNDR